MKKNISGEYTVQVFEENKMVKEVFSKNIVDSTPNFRSSLCLLKANTPFALQGRVYPTYNWSGSTGLDTVYMTGMTLTDNALPPSSSEHFILGKYVSQKTVSNFDKVKFNYSVEDGFLKYRYVCIFAPSDFSGEFRSIYLNSGKDYNDYLVKETAGFPQCYVNLINQDYDGNYKNRVYFRSGNLSVLDLERHETSFTRKTAEPLQCLWNGSLKKWEYYEGREAYLEYWFLNRDTYYEPTPTHKTPFQDSDGNYYHFQWNYPYTVAYSVPVEKNLSVKIEKFSENGAKIKDLNIDFSSQIPSEDLDTCFGVAPLMLHDDKVLFCLSFKATKVGATVSTATNGGRLNKEIFYDLKSESFVGEWVSVGSTTSTSATQKPFSDCIGNGDHNIDNEKTKRRFKQIIDVPYPKKTKDDRLEILMDYQRKVYSVESSESLFSSKIISKNIKFPGAREYTIQGGLPVCSASASDNYEITVTSFNPIHNLHSSLNSRSLTYCHNSIFSTVKQWFSHTTLPEVVSKNDEQTLKITYELSIPLSFLQKSLSNDTLRIDDKTN